MTRFLATNTASEGVQRVQSTSEAAVSLGKSFEDNASTGGGAGSFVYSTSNSLYFSAEGRGGGNAGVNGVNGQYSNSGETSSCIDTCKQGSGGTCGTAIIYCRWCLQGGDCVEGVQGGQSSSETAASRGKSIEDHAGT